MRIFLASLLMTALPLAALAQAYSDAPLVVVGQGRQQVAQAAPMAAATAATATTTPAKTAAATAAQPKVYTPDFPDWAITQVGQNTAGNTNPAPDAAPEAPQAPAAPVPSDAPAPASPTPPPSPVSKVWPRDTVPIFVKSCIGFHVELVPACTCVITNLMGAMPHDEFMRLSESGTIEQDVRLQTIRQQCLTAGHEDN